MVEYKCPKCGSDNIDVIDFGIEDERVYETGLCMDCGCQMTLISKLELLSIVEREQP